MTDFFLPKLESDNPEKKKTKKILNGPIFDTYSFTNRGKIKIHRFKSISKCLITIFGEKAIEIIWTMLSAIVIFFCLGTIILLLFISVYEKDATAIFWKFYISFIILLFLAGITYNALEYHRNSLCRLCGRKLACEEIKEAVINEISTSDEYIVTVVRYWKCKFCGRIDLREGPEDIVAKKGDYQSKCYLERIQFEGIKCKNCGEKNVIEEFRRSDIKEQGSKRVIRNYYKCNNCGYIDIMLSEREIYRG